MKKDTLATIGLTFTTALIFYIHYKCISFSSTANDMQMFAILICVFAIFVVFTIALQEDSILDKRKLVNDLLLEIITEERKCQQQECISNNFPLDDNSRKDLQHTTPIFTTAS